jgi:hypothetical protein
VRFYFPDSQDQIDPSFDFLSEERSQTRVRQRDDLYAHETLTDTPYTGILVSKAIVDGIANGAGRYTFAQRHRLYRQGVRRFFRLDRPNGLRLESLGDCGAFTYVNEDAPPYTVDEVIDFYDGCGFDAGISVDHVILGYRDTSGTLLGTVPPVPDSWVERQQLTLALADEFLRRHAQRRCTFTPLGVAQGWDPPSYAGALAGLQRAGYRRIAIGGMVPLRTNEILRCLSAMDDVRRGDTQLHLLGVTRCEHVEQFARFGVTSFDSTSPFRQAFKDDKDNFYARDRAYAAIRIPQVDGNPKLRREILAGRRDQREAIRLESNCLAALRAGDQDERSVEEVLDAIDAYDSFLGVRSRRQEYRELLLDRPWASCLCGACERLGIQIVIFRGTERNKSRGFHNIFVFNQRLQAHLAVAGARREQEVPA